MARRKSTSCRREGQADEEESAVRLLKEDQQDEYGSHQSNTGHTKLGFNFCFCFDFFF